jgi:hypothetical protein
MVTDVSFTICEICGAKKCWIVQSDHHQGQMQQYKFKYI